MDGRRNAGMCGSGCIVDRRSRYYRRGGDVLDGALLYIIVMDGCRKAGMRDTLSPFNTYFAFCECSTPKALHGILCVC